jgi:hypothetical protein
MTGELDFFDTQVSTETLGADKKELWALTKKEKGEVQDPSFSFLPAGEHYMNTDRP